MKRLCLLSLVFLIALTFTGSRAFAATEIYPDQPWKDIYGNVINAHGGGIYYENGFYHWYGEHKLSGRTENQGRTSGGVHLYRSRDLLNWNDLGMVLTVDYDDPNSDIAIGCRLERPKVVYNESTRTYVCYFKLYLKGDGVRICYVGVATSDSPRGPFTYQKKFLASSTAGSGDFAMFKDPVSGVLYHFAVRKTDRAMVRTRMSNDYLTPGGYNVVAGINVSTEAPAIVYKDGVYHMIGSGSSGWDPNPCRYYTTTNLTGAWTDKGNPCSGINPLSGLGASKTFGGQPTYIITVDGLGRENQFIAMMDVWVPTNPTAGRYIWLPFKIDNNLVKLRWVDSWNLAWYWPAKPNTPPRRHKGELLPVK